MNDHLWGEVTAYAYMVARGKPAGSIPVKIIYIDEIKSFVKNNYGLNVYCEKLSEGWVTLWIYKYRHILDVIKSLKRSPQSAFDHWVQGKLFGYEEAAIAEFLGSQTLSNSV